MSLQLKAFSVLCAVALFLGAITGCPAEEPKVQATPTEAPAGPPAFDDTVGINGTTYDHVHIRNYKDNAYGMQDIEFILQNGKLFSYHGTNILVGKEPNVDVD